MVKPLFNTKLSFFKCPICQKQKYREKHILQFFGGKSSIVMELLLTLVVLSYKLPVTRLLLNMQLRNVLEGYGKPNAVNPRGNVGTSCHFVSILTCPLFKPFKVPANTEHCFHICPFESASPERKKPSEGSNRLNYRNQINKKILVTSDYGLSREM